MNRIKYNLLLAIFTTLLIIASDTIFRGIKTELTTVFHLRDAGVIFVSVYLISLIARLSVVTASLSIIFLIQFLQMVHYSYFGTWIEPLEIYLFFSHLNESFGTLSDFTQIFYLPAAILVINAISMYFVCRYSYPRRVHAKYTGYILLAILLYGPITTMASPENRNHKLNADDYIVKNSIKSINNFLGIVAPAKIIGTSSSELEQPIKQAHLIKGATEKYNIVFVIGESLRYKNMSLFGYNKNTTPLLTGLSADSHFTYKRAISSSVFTDVSIPGLINCIERPDSSAMVIEQNTCLFRLAKEQGYRTYFISSQSMDALNSIRNSLCLKYVDKFTDSYSLTDNYYQNTQDSFLLNNLHSIDLKGDQPSFIVLHQTGSHSPYKKAYTDEYAFLPETSLANEYDNSVRFTDYILDSIIEYVKRETTLPTIIVYTSDHGESLGEHGIIGHGNIQVPDQYHVPFIMYAVNTDIPMWDELSKVDFITHYQISKYISQLLGYSIDNEKVFSNKEIVVTGKDITGLDGYKIIEHPFTRTVSSSLKSDEPQIP
jgi:glucan phosphoethanolaminetransferase (alkaline phosphatase superfamily)